MKRICPLPKAKDCICSKGVTHAALLGILQFLRFVWLKAGSHIIARIGVVISLKVVLYPKHFSAHKVDCLKTSLFQTIALKTSLFLIRKSNLYEKFVNNLSYVQFLAIASPLTTTVYSCWFKMIS